MRIRSNIDGNKAIHRGQQGLWSHRCYMVVFEYNNGPQRICTAWEILDHLKDMGHQLLISLKLHPPGIISTAEEEVDPERHEKLTDGDARKPAQDTHESTGSNGRLSPALDFNPSNHTVKRALPPVHLAKPNESSKKVSCNLG